MKEEGTQTNGLNDKEIDNNALGLNAREDIDIE